jgi:hypothetical protein
LTGGSSRCRGHQRFPSGRLGCPNCFPECLFLRLGTVFPARLTGPGSWPRFESSNPIPKSFSKLGKHLGTENEEGASHPVLVHRLAPLLHASFRPRLAAGVISPLRFANPSSPSDWVEDSHLQDVGHARHTKKISDPLWGRLNLPPV